MSFLQYLNKELPVDSRWILFEGLEYHAERQIYDTILQLEQEILGPLHRQGKVESSTFKLMLRIKNILYQAGEGEARVTELTREIHRMRDLNNYLLDRNADLQLQLSKYQTIEDMLREGSLEGYINKVRTVMKEKMDHDLKAAENLKNQNTP